VEKIETEEIKEAVSAEIIKKTGEEEAIRLIGDIAGPIIDKLTEGQKFAAEEGTKRLKLLIDANLKVLISGFILSVLIIGLAYIALFKGNTDLTEKIIFLVVGFFAGLGFGKAAKKDSE
jgi:hypothetical protein